jgi:uncharacterized protein YjbI with pentapeptide repeats
MNQRELDLMLTAHREYIESHGSAGAIANLSGANLIRANLSDANLIRANLSDANLSGANLSGANLIRANLIRANLSDANLSGANLSDANLIRANLSGANLIRANLSGAIGFGIITEESINDLLEVARIVTTDESKLFMGDVHASCGTAHCGAGWICAINPIAKTLEPILGWNMAACICCPIPEFTSLFYSSDDAMLTFLRSVLEGNGRSLKDKYLKVDPIAEDSQNV